MKQLPNQIFGPLIGIIGESVERLKNHKLNPNLRASGYFYVFHNSEVGKQFPLLHLPVGEVTDWDWLKGCNELAPEKCRRLIDHPDHTTSFESRNHADKKYPEAIRVSIQDDPFVMGFSGCPWKVDEAVLIYASLHLTTNFDPQPVEYWLKGGRENGCLDFLLQES